jgi:putative PIN family toxin of toxin-antitoxin system
LKAVFDTNVLVAAFAAEGLCRKLLQRANRRYFGIAVTSHILAEFERVLMKNLGLTKAEAKNASALLVEIAETVEPGAIETEQTRGICRDPSDDPILAGALACRADYLVTGDKDLLEIRTIGRTKIISPRDFEILFEK